jgi:NAD(P)-dependent dehydrogenase (short-subunit alcohol dehydrogenase family)
MIASRLQAMTQTRTWFITGAAAGLGREWTEGALERGDNVAAAVRGDLSRLDELADRHGERLLALSLDVTDRDQVFSAVARAAERFGRLDVVLNNAGYGHIGMVEELSEDELRAQLETNFFGAVWVTQAALPILRRQGAGHILQNTSEGGVIAYPSLGAYHASKWALEGLTQSLYQEVSGFGIRVTLVEPGPYATGMMAAGSHSAELSQYATVRDASPSEWATGDPRATRQAILDIVDAGEPPLRVFLGRAPLAGVEADYASRLATWRKWQPLSERAFG